MDAEFGGSVPKRNFGMIISNQLHSFEEMCRKGRSGGVMDAEFGGNVLEMNFDMIISNQLLHSSRKCAGN